MQPLAGLETLVAVAALCWCVAVECACAGDGSLEADSVSDSACEDSMASRIRTTFRSMAPGLPEEGLPPMDPVALRDVSFCRGYGAVRANIDFPFSTLAGVSAVDSVSRIRCTPGASLLEFSTHHGRVVQRGEYNMTGSFGDVFAVGKGRAHIVLRDVAVHHRLQWRRARGELRVKEYRGTVVPHDMTVQYDNLRAENRHVLLDECRRERHDGGPGRSRRPSRRSSRRQRRPEPSRTQPLPHHSHRTHARRKSRRRRNSHVDVNKYFNEHWAKLYDALSQSVDLAFSHVFREYMEEVLRAVEPFLNECEGRDDYDSMEY